MYRGLRGFQRWAASLVMGSMVAIAAMALAPGMQVAQAAEKNGVLTDQYCKDTRWRDWVYWDGERNVWVQIFRNQGDCVSYVVRFGKPPIWVVG